MVRFARCRLLRSIAIGHHHNHRLCLALRNQIIQNLRGSAKRSPRFLVAALAVEQVEHRVALAGGFVAGRGVNRDAALHSQRRAIVPPFRHRAMWHIVHTIQIGLRAGHDKNAKHRGNVANHIHIARVGHLGAIHHKIIHIQFRLQHPCGETPHAIGSLHHFGAMVGRRENIRTHYLHALRLRGIKLESDGAVGIHGGRRHFHTFAQGLLRHSR